MLQRLDRIRRATYATDVTIVPTIRGEFSVRVVWKNKDGTVGAVDHEFTRKAVFGASYTNAPLAWRVERKACDYMRDVMRHVLAARGV